MTDKRKTINDVTPKEWDEVTGVDWYKGNIITAICGDGASKAMAETLANPEDDPGFPVMDGIGELTYNPS